MRQRARTQHLKRSGQKAKMLLEAIQIPNHVITRTTRAYRGRIERDDVDYERPVSRNT
jgi:hypothetical protein